MTQPLWPSDGERHIMAYNKLTYNNLQLLFFVF